MIVEISTKYYADIMSAVKQLKIRHSPFIKLSDKYRFYLYPSKNNCLFLIKLSETDINIKEAAGMM